MSLDLTQVIAIILKEGRYQAHAESAEHMSNGDINGRIFWRLALCKERNQPPSHRQTGALAALYSYNRDGLSRGDVVARGECPERLHDGELSLDGRLISGDKSTAHGYQRLNRFTSRSRRSASLAALRASTRLPALTKAIP